MRVIDCCIYHNEREQLIWRMEELWDGVDEFLVVEGSHTFSGHQRTDFLKLNDFPAYREKMRLHVAQVGNHAVTWAKEAAQRNAVWDVLQHEADDTLVMFSDVDELPKLDALEWIILDNPYNQIYALHQKTYYYYLNLLTDYAWQGTRIARIGCIRNDLDGSMQRLRTSSTASISEAGWHFSYLGGVNAIQTKLASFSHQEYNTEVINNAENIRAHLADKTDLFGRPADWQVVAIDESYPVYIQKNKDVYAAQVYSV